MSEEREYVLCDYGFSEFNDLRDLLERCSQVLFVVTNFNIEKEMFTNGRHASLEYGILMFESKTQEWLMCSYATYTTNISSNVAITLDLVEEIFNNTIKRARELLTPLIKQCTDMEFKTDKQSVLRLLRQTYAENENQITFTFGG